MIVNIEEDPRHAGQITRYHTWPVHRQQSVGEHSWQVMRIMVTIWPQVPRELLMYAITHDVGEMAGDIPYPFKQNNPELKGAVSRVEWGVHMSMVARWSLPEPPLLTQEEMDFFKMCEYIEMWEYGLQERNMGNRYGTVVATRCLLAASGLIDKMPSSIQENARRYCAVREDQESETERTYSSDPSDETIFIREKLA